MPLFKIGDTIAIRTGVINDHNGNPVPDGTVVHFSMTLTGEGGSILQQADANTTNGIARVSFGLDKPGLLEIRATSDPATLSEVLQLDVSAGQACGCDRDRANANDSNSSCNDRDASTRAKSIRDAPGRAAFQCVALDDDLVVGGCAFGIFCRQSVGVETMGNPLGTLSRYPAACWLITILPSDCPEARTLPFPMA